MGTRRKRVKEMGGDENELEMNSEDVTFSVFLHLWQSYDTFLSFCQHTCVPLIFSQALSSLTNIHLVITSTTWYMYLIHCAFLQPIRPAVLYHYQSCLQVAQHTEASSDQGRMKHSNQSGHGLAIFFGNLLVKIVTAHAQLLE